MTSPVRFGVILAFVIGQCSMAFDEGEQDAYFLSYLDNSCNSLEYEEMRDDDILSSPAGQVELPFGTAPLINDWDESSFLEILWIPIQNPQEECPNNAQLSQLTTISATNQPAAMESAGETNGITKGKVQKIYAHRFSWSEEEEQQFLAIFSQLSWTTTRIKWLEFQKKIKSRNDSQCRRHYNFLLGQAQDLTADQEQAIIKHMKNKAPGTLANLLEIIGPTEDPFVVIDIYRFTRDHHKASENSVLREGQGEEISPANGSAADRKRKLSPRDQREERRAKKAKLTRPAYHWTEEEELALMKAVGSLRVRVDPIPWSKMGPLPRGQKACREHFQILKQNSTTRFSSNQNEIIWSSYRESGAIFTDMVNALNEKGGGYTVADVAKFLSENKKRRKKEDLRLIIN